MHAIQTHDVSTLIKVILFGLVKHPEAVEVMTVECPSLTLFEVEVDEFDRGRVIGREGRTIGAMRELLFQIGQRTGRRFVLALRGDRYRGTPRGIHPRFRHSVGGVSSSVRLGPVEGSATVRSLLA